MSFSQFKTIADVQKIYNIKYQEASFIKAIDIEVPPGLIEDLQFNQEYIDVFSSEAARSELIISPLLRSVYKNHRQNYSFWIQKSIEFDQDLCGTPDYMFSKRSALGKTVLETPIVIIVEAKKNDFEHGWGQCLAELVASQKLNDDPDKSIYGVVTDGNLWQFGYLCTTVFTKDDHNYTIDNLKTLYGALDYLVTLGLSD
ncbi:MAG: hypothetical protein ACO3NK_17115 [Prochlorotrichaceae cyanobacterium]|jgi:hypothetical protein